MRTRFVLFLLCFHLIAFSQDLSIYERHYFNAPELNLPYRLLRPASFDSTRKYPMIIFLHGSLQKGFDNEAPLLIGGKFFLTDSIRQRYPAYILFPQCPEIDSWCYFETTIDFETGKATKWNFPFKRQPTEVSTVLMKLLDSLKRSDAVDSLRIYIGGISQGGMGVVDLIARFPQTFAAAFSICGAGNIGTYKRFAHNVALWLFHGNKDDIVPSYFSSNFYRKLSKAGANVLYTEYDGVGHASWTNAFKEPALLNWLFSNHKKK